MKSKKPLISIIINCFNGQEFLRETLNSVMNQTYKNWELIFWDNQSSDRSIDILKEFKNPKIRYFYSSVHTDLGKARELAIRKSKGQWIGFLDCDDIWLPNKLKQQVNIINSYKGNLGMIYSKCQLFKDIRNKRNQIFRKTAIQPCQNNLPSINIYKDLIKGNFIPFPSILYKKNAILQTGKFSFYKFSPDYYLNLSIALKYDCYAIDKVLCLYRFHQSNLSKLIKETGILEAINIIYRLHPKCEADKFSKTHKVRYVFFLLIKFNFIKAFNYILDLGLLNLLKGFIEIIIYFFRFKTKI